LLCNDNQTIQRLNQRQIIINIDNPESFYCVVTKTLEHYNLHVFQLQLEGLQLADEWRKEQSFVTVIEICVGSCYGTFLAG
jgi:hypothetical protein